MNKFKKGDLVKVLIVAHKLENKILTVVDPVALVYSIGKIVKIKLESNTFHFWEKDLELIKSKYARNLPAWF